jgi:hypothetical protein
MTDADGIVIIVINGTHGDGFSAQGDVELALKLPDLLEEMARSIRNDSNYKHAKN